MLELFRVALATENMPGCALTVGLGHLAGSPWPVGPWPCECRMCDCDCVIQSIGPSSVVLVSFGPWPTVNLVRLV